MSEKEKEELEQEEVTTEAAEETVEEEKTEPTAEEKLKEQMEKYMRLFAEYDNFRKRSQREKDMRYGDAVIDAAAAILPIGDNLERALQTEVESEDAKKLKEGVEMVLKQFTETLEKLGVKEIKAEGEQFDPNLHNAVMHIEDETIDDNTVVEDLMKGYIYKDGRVVRHSMVKVAN
ncbi:MAG: nucleotide exchange factor GrpE [Clostridia bacterium]|nr:nucleotide exchange factor GrpE [Clostridia bacterium]MBQ9599462.1 nucleotide exchange factor GrpE [Clostridia bacterium]